MSLNLVDAKDIPLTLFCFSELKLLFIERSTFHTNSFRLPAAIERLASSLIELHIFDMPIITLPEQIGKMELLEVIELHWTGLIQLPESIGALSSLRILSLSHNDISSLPKSMRKMSSLTHLTLSNNPRLTSLQPINGHPALIVLIANNCSIEQIPRNLPKLERMSLSSNDLTSLEGIETLSNATKRNVQFYFDSNQIKTIPPEIRFLDRLTVLNLNDNALYYLPTDLARAPSLISLHLKKNALSRTEVVRLASIIRTTRPHLKIFY